MSEGEAIQADPTGEDFTQGGVQPVLIGTTPVTAYLITLDQTTTGAFVELGETALLVMGPFERAGFEQVARLLAAR